MRRFLTTAGTVILYVTAAFILAGAGGAGHEGMLVLFFLLPATFGWLIGHWWVLGLGLVWWALGSMVQPADPTLWPAAPLGLGLSVASAAIGVVLGRWQSTRPLT
jgi:hypothetical protein